MLRTMISDGPFEQRWVLQGRLCAQWAEDLKQRWEASRSTREGRKCSVDLQGVISVDEKGKRVLVEMATEGAEFVASGLYIKHLLGSLLPQCQQRCEETK